MKRVSRRLTGRKVEEDEDRQAVRKSRRRGVVTVGSREDLTRDVEKGSGRKKAESTMEIEMKEGKKKEKIFGR